MNLFIEYLKLYFWTDTEGKTLYRFISQTVHGINMLNMNANKVETFPPYMIDKHILKYALIEETNT